MVEHSYRHDRLSVISGLSVSPKQQRLNLYYQIYPHNIRRAQVCDFLRHLLRHLRGHVIVVWDNIAIHGGSEIQKLCQRHPRLHLERLPAYAPDLNPDEGIWKLAKQALANGRPDTIYELWPDVVGALEQVRRSRRQLRGCIHGSELPFVIP